MSVRADGVRVLQSKVREQSGESPDDEDFLRTGKKRHDGSERDASIERRSFRLFYVDIERFRRLDVSGGRADEMRVDQEVPHGDDTADDKRSGVACHHFTTLLVSLTVDPLLTCVPALGLSDCTVSVFPLTVAV